MNLLIIVIALFLLTLITGLIAAIADAKRWLRAPAGFWLLGVLSGWLILLGAAVLR